MVDTEPKLQLVFLASVEKGFTPEVGQRLLDAVKASFVEAFDAEAVEQAPELGLSSSFAPQLRALHVLAAHQARFSAEYEDRLLSAMALRQAQADSPPAHRDAKAEPLLHQPALSNHCEDFSPSYKKFDDSQAAESLSDQAILKSRYAVGPHSEARLVAGRGRRLSRRAKRLLLAAALVALVDQQLLLLAGVAVCVCCCGGGGLFWPRS